MEFIKNLYNRIFHRYESDSRRYHDSLIRKFEDSDTDEVI